MSIETERVYEHRGARRGKQFLVDRMWPRGIKKSELAGATWLKDVAPSAELRRWFGHDPKRWPEFVRRYSAELRAQREAIAPLRNAAARGRVVLLFGAKDVEHNNAVALKRYLERSGPRRRRR